MITSNLFNIIQYLINISAGLRDLVQLNTQLSNLIFITLLLFSLINYYLLLLFYFITFVICHFFNDFKMSPMSQKSARFHKLFLYRFLYVKLSPRWTRTGTFGTLLFIIIIIFNLYLLYYFTLLLLLLFIFINY